MPATKFVCPSGEEVLIRKCLASCPSGTRCLLHPTLSAIAAAVSPILQPFLETQQSLSNGG